MTIKSKAFSPLLLLPIGILLCLIFLSKSTVIHSRPDVWLGLTLDLLITIPVLYYFLIRKSNIPKFTVLSVFVICMITASYIIPLGEQGLLSMVKKIAIPIIEIGLFALVIIKFISFIKAYEIDRSKNLDDFDKIKVVCQEILPGRIGNLLATEIGVVYYGFIKNRAKPFDENHFSYHQKSGIKSIIFILIFLIMIETMVVHVLLLKWSHAAAYILTLLSIYTCLQFIALSRSLNKRLIHIDTKENLLKLRNGFFNQCYIPFSHIASIELSQKSLPDKSGLGKLSALDMLDVHNVIIHFSELQTLYKIYGMKKRVDGLAIFVDEKEEFLRKIEMVQERH